MPTNFFLNLFFAILFSVLAYKDFKRGGKGWGLLYLVFAATSIWNIAQYLINK